MTNFKIIITVFSLFLLLTTPVLAENDFSDVPKTHWAYSAIQTLSQKEIVRGYPDGTFKPSVKITREQFAIILVKTLDIPFTERSRTNQTFWDIDENHRSFFYIDAAKPYIPVPDPKGYAFNFYPNRPITREEAAHAIALALNLNRAQKPDDKYLASKFKDYQNISPEFKEGVAFAAYYRILSGDSEGNFTPKAPLSRAELCVIMNIILQNKSTVQSGFQPSQKPWTIRFNNFQRPDWEMVRDFPDYNKIQSFYGKVTEKVYGFNNSHIIVTYSNINDRYEDDYEPIEQTVTVYLADKDMELFSKREWVTFYYDRNNNIISYSIDGVLHDVSKEK